MDYIPLHRRQEPQPEPRWLQIVDTVTSGIVALSMAGLLGLFLVTHAGCGDDSAGEVTSGTSTTSGAASSTSGETDVHTVTGLPASEPDSSSSTGLGLGGNAASSSDTSTGGADTSSSDETSSTSGEEISTSTGADLPDSESSTGPTYQPAVCFLSPCVSNSHCAYGAVFENMCFGLQPSMCTHPCVFDEDCVISGDAGDAAMPPGNPPAPSMRCDESWCKPYSCSGLADPNCDCREWWPGTFYCH